MVVHCLTRYNASSATPFGSCLIFNVLSPFCPLSHNSHSSRLFWPPLPEMANPGSPPTWPFLTNFSTTHSKMDSFVKTSCSLPPQKDQPSTLVATSPSGPRFWRRLYACLHHLVFWPCLEKSNFLSSPHWNFSSRSPPSTCCFLILMHIYFPVLNIFFPAIWVVW